MALDVTSYLLGKKNAGGGGGSSIEGQKIFTFEGDLSWLQSGSGTIEGTENIQKLNEIAGLFTAGKCPHIALTFYELYIWLNYNYTASSNEDDYITFTIYGNVNLGDNGNYNVNINYISAENKAFITLQKYYEGEYSTEEKRIGTWIDGKPLYQKVYLDTTPTATSTSSVAKTIDISSLNAENIFIKTSYLTTNAGNRMNLPVFDGTSSVIVVKDFVSPSNIEINSNNSSRNNLPVTIIINYTKTTD